MQFPASLRPVRDMVSKYRSRLPAISMSVKLPVTTGTSRTPPMGSTMPHVQDTQTQFGEAPDIPNSQVRWSVGTRINPSFVSESPPGTRQEQLRSDVVLQVGPDVGRIPRIVAYNVMGNIGPSGFAFPMTQGLGRLPHSNAAHPAQQVKGYHRVFDDALTIPAVYAGNVRM